MGTVTVVGVMATDVIVAVVVLLLPQAERLMKPARTRAMLETSRNLNRISGNRPRQIQQSPYRTPELEGFPFAVVPALMPVA
jgi:hypothetical protein